jgi:hypothetical protein
MLHIVKLFQYLLHAIDFVNARNECSAARGKAFLPHTLRQVRTAERTQVEITSIAEMED